MARRALFPVILLTAVLLLAGAGTALSGPWEDALQGAKKEGTVSVIASVGSDFRQVLTTPFEKKFGIRVEYISMQGSAQSARVSRERRAGKYLWDVFVQGTSTALIYMKPQGIIDPIEPALLLPEVTEGKYWEGGSPQFSDKDHYNVLLGLVTRPAFAINTKLVKVSDFTAFRDLLDPKWKGKIIVGRDPRGPGPGQSIFTFFYMNPKLGPDFIRALAKQNLTVLRDDRQSLDMLGRGRFSILLGPAETVTSDLAKVGVPVGLVPPQGLAEGGPLSPGPASLMLVNRAPHPNAARVYINWLLSREGQTEFTKVTGIPSLRVDVPKDHIESWRFPMKGGTATYTEEAIGVKDGLMVLLKEVLTSSSR